ncbi:hypothetical protein ACLOJK_001351 [Asimina triloba]
MPEYCVTGGTGFIAAYLVKALLEKGYHVRTTVRNPGACAAASLPRIPFILYASTDRYGCLISGYLNGADDVGKVGFLRSMNGAEGRLKILKADLMAEGSFDDAVDGVDGVFHTASPVLVPYDDNVQASTMNVMKSCARARSVKRVVLTSSSSTIRYRDDATQISPLNESHWSDTDYCKRYKLWYAYAKTIGEKEAWRLAKENGIDLVVVNPSFVVGPVITPEPTSTLRVILGIVKGETGFYPNTTVGFVHSDDAIAAHIIAMEDNRAQGRLICSGSVAHWSEIVQMIKAEYPSCPIASQCRGQEGDSNPHSMDTSKIEQLGLPAFKSISQMFDDCIKSFQERGFL